MPELIRIVVCLLYVICVIFRKKVYVCVCVCTYMCVCVERKHNHGTSNACVRVRQGETVNEVEIIARDNNNNNIIMTDGAVRKQ